MAPDELEVGPPGEGGLLVQVDPGAVGAEVVAVLVDHQRAGRADGDAVGDGQGRPLVRRGRRRGGEGLGRHQRGGGRRQHHQPRGPREGPGARCPEVGGQRGAEAAGPADQDDRQRQQGDGDGPGGRAHDAERVDDQLGDAAPAPPPPASSGRRPRARSPAGQVEPARRRRRAEAARAATARYASIPQVASGTPSSTDQGERATSEQLTCSLIVAEDRAGAGVDLAVDRPEVGGDGHPGQRQHQDRGGEGPGRRALPDRRRGGRAGVGTGRRRHGRRC